MKAIQDGRALLYAHPLFGRLLHDIHIATEGFEPFPKDGYARLYCHVPQRAWQRSIRTDIHANPYRKAEPAEWAHVLGQAVLHYWFCHADPARTDEAWRAACELSAAEFLRALNVGRRPFELTPAEQPSLGRDPEAIAERLLEGGPDMMAQYAGWGLAGAGAPTIVYESGLPPLEARVRRDRQRIFAEAIRESVVAAIEQAGQIVRTGPAGRDPNSLAERARSWFVTEYPLLGALAASFDIVQDAQICQLHDIALAAVDPELRRIYINPRFAWTWGGMKFVMAHELLHVGLRHEARRQGRDAYLWNVACDYVINGWLIEMGVGEPPTDGLLLDPELGFERESAEAIYDRIVGDLRLIRRLNKARTMRGVGKVDVLGERPPAWWNGPGTDLDAFYRRALADGLDLHLQMGERGLLPGDLIEEIRAIQQKPIPWDVRLGQWMDAFFPPLEARRSFARASRRQASTPDIPRPIWVRPEEQMAARTFGVVLDTSGSMPPRLLAKALGAIASYAMSREVPAVRVMQCDAGVHDMGYVEPESLLGQVEVRGRGGTVLQPAVSRLESDRNFPKDAPILVITDGGCDHLTFRREHAYLMPEGARLPYGTSAPRFAFEAAE